MIRIHKTIHRGQNTVETNIIHKLSSKIDCTQNSNTSKRLLHGFVHNLINETKVLCPWLTCNKLMILNCYQAKKKKSNKVENTSNRCVPVYYSYFRCTQL